MTNSLPALSLRISVTDRCQLRCGYCMPEEGITCYKHEDILSFEEIIKIVKNLQTIYNVDKIRLTGGEPLLRRGIVTLIKMLKDLDIPDLALTTNGQMLSEMATGLKKAGLHRINISLDSLDSKLYSKMTRGGNLALTLDGINAALATKMHPVKLNSVIMQGKNEHEVCQLLKFAIEHNCEQRFLEIMPIGHGAGIYSTEFISTDTVIDNLKENYTLTPIGRENGSSAVRYQAVDKYGNTGKVGFISPCTAPFCADCRRLRITPDGSLVGCLARGSAIPIRDKIPQTEDFLKIVSTVLGEKRTDAAFSQSKIMATIGG